MKAGSNNPQNMAAGLFREEIKQHLMKSRFLLTVPGTTDLKVFRTTPNSTCLRQKLHKELMRRLVALIQAYLEDIALQAKFLLHFIIFFFDFGPRIVSRQKKRHPFLTVKSSTSRSIWKGFGISELFSPAARRAQHSRMTIATMTCVKLTVLHLKPE